MEFIRDLLKKQITKSIIILLFLVLLLYIMKSLVNLFLLTFIITYLLSRIQNFVSSKIKNYEDTKQKVIVISVYLLFLLMFVFILYKYTPIMLNETRSIINQAIVFYNKPHETEFEKYLVSISKDVNIDAYFKQGIDIVYKSLTNIGNWSVNILLALILSLFFSMEKNKLIKFTQKFKDSKLSGLYNELAFFGNKFISSFGKVMEAQIIIACVNSILSVICLFFMGFPELFGLGIMIFVLSLIPVAGAFISLIPLSIIAFSIGGVTKVVYVLIMIALLHSIEAYFLNPKLMSSKTKLPLFYTLVILILSEYFLGVWGLIIGMPIFIFLLDIFEVKV